VGEICLGIPSGKVRARIDHFNQMFYHDPERRFLLAVLALHESKGPEGPFFTLETVEVDSMGEAMVQLLYGWVRDTIDPSVPLLFKPVHHDQERMLRSLDPKSLPRIYSHELFEKARHLVLHPGETTGRLRYFRDEEEYRQAHGSFEWFDIIVMNRIPDDVPRVSGMIHLRPTTPLSHTNVLAAGWQIPNSVDLDFERRVREEGWNGAWVRYVARGGQTLGSEVGEVLVERSERPTNLRKPEWSLHHIELEQPLTEATPILPLDALRVRDRYKYGTKAANLGEMHYVLRHGSEKLTGFYRVKRPPRNNLLPYLARQLGLLDVETESSKAEQALTKAAHQFLRAHVQVPRGIAVPFSLQREFLESSPRIQQMIGKLKMALELQSPQVEALSLGLMQLIRGTRLPDRIQGLIDEQIAYHLAGVTNFVVRSSSNAEDLEGFSAAGIYESITHVSTAERIFESVKEVWASLLSPRSVRLREQVGISLDDCYMGVIIQEEVPAKMGGVLVTTHPMNPEDFRKVYINLSGASVQSVVEGETIPQQFLFNVVEGGSRTLTLGDSHRELREDERILLSKLALAGRLLQAHFAPDYTFKQPVDIEWVWGDEGLYLLQLRPYAES
jgi:hypothetical protein